MINSIHITALTLGVIIAVCYAQTSTKPEATTTVGNLCKSLDADCGKCLQNSKCLWCNKNVTGAHSHCVPYPVGDLIPRGDTCPLSEARWGVCWLNYQALLITMGVIAGVIVLSITCCCVYCCCCRSKARREQRFAAEDARTERDRNEREVRNSDRRKERQSKYDEIRKKYGIGQFGHSNHGLTKDDGYKRFDDE